MPFIFITLIYFLNMNPILTDIKKASDGLLFISESEHPLEKITFLKPAGAVADYLKSISDKNNNTPAETQTLEYFFRNMTRVNEGDDKATAERFKALETILKQKLKNIQVYRIGSVEVQAFIVGELPDGSYAGLKTLLIET